MFNEISYAEMAGWRKNIVDSRRRHSVKTEDDSDDDFVPHTPESNVHAPRKKSKKVRITSEVQSQNYTSEYQDSDFYDDPFAADSGGGYGDGHTKYKRTRHASLPTPEHAFGKSDKAQRVKDILEGKQRHHADREARHHRSKSVSLAVQKGNQLHQPKVIRTIKTNNGLRVRFRHGGRAGAG
jgi:hypothetical protein